MSLPVLVAVKGATEAPLVSALAAPGGRAHVVRRCADLAELLSAASAGLARAAVVSASLPMLDRDAVAHLAAAGVSVVGLADDMGDHEIRHLHRLGIAFVAASDAPAPRITDLLEQAVEADEAEAAARAATPSGAVPLPPWLPRGDAGSQATGRDPRPPTGSHLPPSPAPPGRSRRRLLPPKKAPSTTTPASTTPPTPHATRPTTPHATPPTTPHATPPTGPRATTPAPGRDGAVVAVWGPVGSPGRTTVAVTLAAELAASGRSTLLVDADTYGAAVAQTLGLLDESAGLAAAARAANQGALDTARLARLAPVVSDGLRVLTGLPRPGRWPELRPPSLDVVWQQARSLAPWTVIDCGFCLESDEEASYDVAVPRRNGATLSALAAADLVLVVGGADPVGIQRVVRGLQDLHDAMPDVTALVVMNRVRSSAVGASPDRRVTDALERYAGVSHVVLVPDDPQACDRAMLAGRTLTEAAPTSSARLALQALAVSLERSLPIATGQS